MVLYLNLGVLDHSPQLISFGVATGGGGRPFRFFNHLLKKPQFHDIVKQVWCKQVNNTMAKVWQAIKDVRVELKKLHLNEYGGVQEKIQQAREQLEVVQASLTQDPLQSSLLENE